MLQLNVTTLVNRLLWVSGLLVVLVVPAPFASAGEGFVRAMLAQLRARVNVDPQRIFATGMSNCGMLSHRLACEMADTFRAIAPVAGTDGTLNCSPARPISVLLIHAKNDTHVLLAVLFHALD